DLGSDTEFLVQFPAQGIAGLLALLDFASGELPFQRHGLMPRSLADKNFARFPDEGRDDSFHRTLNGATRLPDSTFQRLDLGNRNHRRRMESRCYRITRLVSEQITRVPNQEITRFSSIDRRPSACAKCRG